MSRGETVTVIHPGAVLRGPDGEPLIDDYGEPRHSPPVPEDVEGCAVAPGDTRENANQQQTVAVEFTVYVPAGHTVEPTAQLVVRGRSLEVEGQPKEWRHPNGWEPGTEVALYSSQ